MTGRAKASEKYEKDYQKAVDYVSNIKSKLGSKSKLADDSTSEVQTELMPNLEKYQPKIKEILLKLMPKDLELNDEKRKSIDVFVEKAIKSLEKSDNFLKLFNYVKQNSFLDELSRYIFDDFLLDFIKTKLG